KQLDQLAPKMISVKHDSETLQPSETRARFADQNNIEFTLIFPVGTIDTLKVGSPLIDSLPRGHRQFLSVTDQTGHKLKECLLSASASTADFARAAAPVSATPSFLGFLM